MIMIYEGHERALYCVSLRRFSTDVLGCIIDLNLPANVFQFVGVQYCM
jgi:hypothetical protein